MEAVGGRLKRKRGRAGARRGGGRGGGGGGGAEKEAAAAGQAVRQVKSKQEGVISGKQYFSPNFWPLGFTITDNWTGKEGSSL